MHSASWQPDWHEPSALPSHRQTRRPRNPESHLFGSTNVSPNQLSRKLAKSGTLAKKSTRLLWRVCQRTTTCIHTRSSAIRMTSTCAFPSQLWLVVIYQPGRDGRLSRPWCEVAPAEIRTCNLPITNAALYHTATIACTLLNIHPSLHVCISQLALHGLYGHFNVLFQDWLAGFTEAKDDGGGDDNWTYKSSKAPVKSSPCTNQHPFQRCQ